MELIEKTIKTGSTEASACQLKWNSGWLFIVEASDGVVLCGSFDVEAFDIPAAKVVPEPGKPAYSIDEFVERKITYVNQEAAKRGLHVGMKVLSAVNILNT